MTIRRPALVGLGVLAAATLAVSGCTTPSTSKGGGGAPASSAAASPTPVSARDAVLASTRALSETTHKYTISGDGATGTGVADPVARKSTMSFKVTQDNVGVSLDIILIGADMWLKMDLPSGLNASIGIPTKFMHIDQSKVTNKATAGFNLENSDPADSATMLKGVVDAKRVDDLHYTVTLDLTQATGSGVSQQLATALGDKANAVPATVVLDDKGRLTELTPDLSAADPATSLKVTYSDYGAPVTVNKPAASNTVEAPAKLYELLKQQ